MKNNANTIFKLSFFTSTILCVSGLLMFIFPNNSAKVILISLLLMLIGGVQIIADLGWIAIVKVNHDLVDWKDAYSKVVAQRTQNFFIAPIIIDISFIIVSIMLLWGSIL